MTLPLTCWYRGDAVLLQPIAWDGRVRGYHLICPGCQRGMFINTGIGDTPDHVLMQDGDGRVTLTPFLECPFPDCAWTGRIAHGIIYPARRRHDRHRPMPLE